MHKINLMIIGAQKAGTTSLKNYLGEHPDIVTHELAEFAYFYSEKEYNEGFDKALNFYFSTLPKQNQILVAKNAGISGDEKAIKRLHEHNPNCKIILLLREPVKRAYSSYQMEWSKGLLKRNFDEIVDVINLKKEDDQFYRLLIKLGLYSDQIKILFKYFNKENVKFYLFEEFKDKTPQICDEIFDWLDLTPSDVKINFEKKHNESSYPKLLFLARFIRDIKSNNNKIGGLIRKILPRKFLSKLNSKVHNFNRTKSKFPPINPEVELILKAYFKPYNEELKNIIDLNLEKWN